MIDLDYHKGHPCIYPPFKFCQEGYCSGCDIHQQMKKMEKILSEPVNIVSSVGVCPN